MAGPWLLVVPSICWVLATRLDAAAITVAAAPNQVECRAPPFSSMVVTDGPFYASPSTQSLSEDQFSGDDFPLYGLGTQLSVRCRPGYSPVARTFNITCSKDSTWQPNNTCNPLRCSNVGEPVNGVLTQVSSPTPDRPTAFGAVAVYSCNEGYQMIGSPRSSCLLASNGAGVEWVPDPPICKQIQCRPPAPIDNASFQPVKDEYGYGEVVTYTCAPGLTPQGQPSRVCLGGSREWEPGSALRCLKISCTRPNIPNSKMVPLKRIYSVLDSLRVECNLGFSMTGPAQLSCGSSGAWGPLPTCEPTAKGAPTSAVSGASGRVLIRDPGSSPGWRDGENLEGAQWIERSAGGYDGGSGEDEGGSGGYEGRGLGGWNNDASRKGRVRLRRGLINRLLGPAAGIVTPAAGLLRTPAAPAGTVTKTEPKAGLGAVAGIVSAPVALLFGRGGGVSEALNASVPVLDEDAPRTRGDTFVSRDLEKAMEALEDATGAEGLLLINHNGTGPFTSLKDLAAPLFNITGAPSGHLGTTGSLETTTLDFAGIVASGVGETPLVPVSPPTAGGVALAATTPSPFQFYTLEITGLNATSNALPAALGALTTAPSPKITKSPPRPTSRERDTLRATPAQSPTTGPNAATATSGSDIDARFRRKLPRAKAPHITVGPHHRHRPQNVLLPLLLMFSLCIPLLVLFVYCLVRL
nr:complement control protein [Eptesicus fuscus gammaherpesvirus]